MDGPAALGTGTRKDTASGTLSVLTVTSDATIFIPEGETAVAVLLGGALAVKIDRHLQRPLQQLDAVIAAGDDLVFRGTAVIALIRVH